MTKEFTIRWLTADSVEADASELLRLLHALAQYEGWAKGMDITQTELIRRAQLPETPFRAVVAEVATGSTEKSGARLSLVGVATLLTTNYSFSMRPALELETLYVDGDWRRQGVGQAIMDAVIAHAKGGGYTKVEWNVLKSNLRAQAFYAQLGGKEQGQWARWRFKV